VVETGFFFLIDTAIVNAYILYSQSRQSSRKLTHVNFGLSWQKVYSDRQVRLRLFLLTLLHNLLSKVKQHHPLFTYNDNRTRLSAGSKLLL